MKKKVTYSEPPEYFPEELRKKYGLGEYNEAYNKKEQQEKTGKGLPEEEEEA